MKSLAYLLPRLLPPQTSGKLYTVPVNTSNDCSNRRCTLDCYNTGMSNINADYHSGHFTQPGYTSLVKNVARETMNELKRVYPVALT